MTATAARLRSYFAGTQTSSALLSLAALPMAVILVLVIAMFWVSLQKGALGTPSAIYTLANYREVFADPFIIGVAVNTLIFTVTATLVALLFGLPVAWLVERTTLPGKTLLYAIMTLGLLIPGIYTAMGWTLIAHPRIGLVNRWLVDLFNLDAGPINIATPIGMGFVQGLSLAALAFILTSQMFRAMNPSLEEAARVHGMSFSRIMRRITLPLARPGILAAVIYIFTIGIATFDIPAILGLGNRVYLLSTFIYLKVHPQGAGLPEYGITGVVGAFMIIVAGLLTLWYSQVLRQGHRFEVVTGKGYKPTLIPLGRWSLAAWGFIFVYALFSKLLPLLLIAYAALTPYFVPPSMECDEASLLQPLSRHGLGIGVARFEEYRAAGHRRAACGALARLRALLADRALAQPAALCAGVRRLPASSFARSDSRHRRFVTRALCHRLEHPALRFGVDHRDRLHSRPPGFRHPRAQRLALANPSRARRSRLRLRPVHRPHRLARPVPVDSADAYFPCGFGRHCWSTVNSPRRSSSRSMTTSPCRR